MANNEIFQFADDFSLDHYGEYIEVNTTSIYL